MIFRDVGLHIAALAGLLFLFTSPAFGQGISREAYSGLDKHLQIYPKLKAAEFLEIPVEARGVALAGAYSAIGTGISSLWWNPAGLSHLSGFETSVSFFPHDNYFNYTIFSAGIPLIRDKLAVGGYFGYFDLPEFQKPYNYQAAACLTYRLNGNIAFGISAKRVYQRFLTGSGTSLVVDAGVLYEYSRANQIFSASLAAQNFGQDLKLKLTTPESDRESRVLYRYGMPFGASLGLGYRYNFTERAGFLVAYEYRKLKKFPDSFSTISNMQSVGAEFSFGFSHFLTTFLRAGMLSHTGRNVMYGRDGSENSTGFGFLIQLSGRQIQLDYARNFRQNLKDWDFLTLRVGI